MEFDSVFNLCVKIVNVGQRIGQIPCVFNEKTKRFQPITKKKDKRRRALAFTVLTTVKLILLVMYMQDWYHGQLQLSTVQDIIRLLVVIPGTITIGCDVHCLLRIELLCHFLNAQHTTMRGWSKLYSRTDIPQKKSLSYYVVLLLVVCLCNTVTVFPLAFLFEPDIHCFASLLPTRLASNWNIPWIIFMIILQIWYIVYVVSSFWFYGVIIIPFIIILIESVKQLYIENTHKSAWTIPEFRKTTNLLRFYNTGQLLTSFVNAAVLYTMYPIVLLAAVSIFIVGTIVLIKVQLPTVGLMGICGIVVLLLVALNIFVHIPAFLPKNTKYFLRIFGQKPKSKYMTKVHKSLRPWQWVCGPFTVVDMKLCVDVFVFISIWTFNLLVAINWDDKKLEN